MKDDKLHNANTLAFINTNNNISCLNIFSKNINEAKTIFMCNNTIITKSYTMVTNYPCPLHMQYTSSISRGRYVHIDNVSTTVCFISI